MNNYTNIHTLDEASETTVRNLLSPFYITMHPCIYKTIYLIINREYCRQKTRINTQIIIFWVEYFWVANICFYIDYNRKKCKRININMFFSNSLFYKIGKMIWSDVAGY